MDTSNIEETAPLVSRTGIPTAVRDTRRPYQKQLAVYLILASTLFERIAFYSLATNLTDTLQSSNNTLPWDFIQSSAGPYVFSVCERVALVFSLTIGTSYLSTLIFAVISDAKLGRARTIIIGFTLYLIGYTLLTITATGKMPSCRFNVSDNSKPIIIENEKCAPTFLGILICTAIGAGAVKSNIAVVGAEQIQESKLTSRYFDKYGMAVSLGIMTEILVIPYIRHKGLRYYSTAYLVAALMLFVSALLFIIGWRYYIHIKPYDTVVTNCIPVVKNAFQTWRQYKKNKRLVGNNYIDSSVSNLANASNSLTEQEDLIRIDERPSTFLDFAKAANHGKFNDRMVDDVKSLRSALVVFSLLIPYWFVYSQIDTTFLSQGQYMRYSSDTSYVIFWVSLGNPVTTIIGILILNIFVYKYVHARNTSLTIITKLIIGMCFACITMCIAGIVEMVRQQECDGMNESNLSIYAQLPQTIFMGLSQLFALVATYEFAYFAAPHSAQSLFMSLHFCSIGIPSFIGTARMHLFSTRSFNFDFQCPPDKQMYSSFYNYFFILGAIQLIFIIIFVVCQKKFQIIKLNRQHMETTVFLEHPSSSSIV